MCPCALWGVGLSLTRLLSVIPDLIRDLPPSQTINGVTQRTKLVG